MCDRGDIRIWYNFNSEVGIADAHLTALSIQILLMLAESANLAQKLVWFDEKPGAQ